MSVAEEVPQGKMSIVREAIEVALESYGSAARAFPFWSFPPFTFGPDSRSVIALLRAAWLSLPKCLVCGREDGYEGHILDASPLSAYPGGFTFPPSEGPRFRDEWWHEPVCSKCRQHPTIKPFEEF